MIELSKVNDVGAPLPSPINYKFLRLVLFKRCYIKHYRIRIYITNM